MKFNLEGNKIHILIWGSAFLAGVVDYYFQTKDSNFFFAVVYGLLVMVVIGITAAVGVSLVDSMLDETKKGEHSYRLLIAVAAISLFVIVMSLLKYTQFFSPKDY